MRWKVKAVIQKFLSAVPQGRSMNDCLQQKVGGLRDFERNVTDKINNWKLTLRYLRDCNVEIVDSTLFEIGTGWYPTLPICFGLAGAKCVVSYDIVCHTSIKLTFRMLSALEGHLDAIAGASGTPLGEVQERYYSLRQAQNIKDLLKRARVELCAPADARATELPSCSVDLVYSNSVMEHVPKETIRDIMFESKRILRPGGVALHNVACNDHYAHIDPEISFVNYLQYDESQWNRWWNNSLQYQNRLRAPEFCDLATEAGFEVIYKRTNVRPGTREALATLHVASDFLGFSTEDLATTSIDFVAQKPSVKSQPTCSDCCR
jgi:SAM-dependent methyltransferase